LQHPQVGDFQTSTGMAWANARPGMPKAVPAALKASKPTS
jgi:hypothetical protein